MAESEKLAGDFFHKLKQTPRNPIPALYRNLISTTDRVPVLEIAPCKPGIWLRGISPKPASMEAWTLNDVVSTIALTHEVKLIVAKHIVAQAKHHCCHWLFGPFSTQEIDDKSSTSRCCKVYLSADAGLLALVQRRPPCSAAFLFRRTLLQSWRCLEIGRASCRERVCQYV